MRFLTVAALASGMALAGVASAQEFDLVAPQVRVMTPGSGSFLGVGVAEISAERAKALKLKEERGVEITRVEEDSPAAKAGLKTGDVVLEYNGQRVEGTEQFVRMVRETPAGRQARLVISRDGATQTLTATIGARKGARFFIGEPFESEKMKEQVEKLRSEVEQRRSDLDKLSVQIDIPQAYMSWQSGALGVTAEALENQLAEYFGVKEGVLVRSVAKGSAAEKAGIKAGDVITKVDDSKVGRPRDITAAIRKLGSKTTFPVTLVRSHKEMSVTVSLPERGKTSAPAPPARPVSTGAML